MNTKQFIKGFIPYNLYKVLKRPYIEDTLSPTIFNAKGKAMELMFLGSDETSHTPYSLVAGRFPENILWDRNNYKLKKHLYTSNNVFHTLKGGETYFAMLGESEVIIPEIYQNIRKKKSYIENTFDAFFTHSEDLLNSFSNAKFVPASGVWYGTEKWGGQISDKKNKTKEISIVASNKSMCAMHEFRRSVALHLVDNSKVDVMGKVVNKYVSCADIFDLYRYSIVIENAIEPYYFTEKIMNCFASLTVPIYIGATCIGDFFNLDGIIVVKEPTLKAIDDAVAQCCEKDYTSRMEAVFDNYQRVQDYLCTEDYIYNKYNNLFQ